MKLKNLFNKEKAQTVIELGVFGSILLFVIAGIVHQTLYAGTSQNQYLKAMRWAMTMSAKYSLGVGYEPGETDYDQKTEIGFGAASRSTTNVMVLEDRLSSTLAKFGEVDRFPTMSSASATLSRHLFYQSDYDENNNRGVYDMFINGKHFVFTTSSPKVVCLRWDTTKCDDLSDPDDMPTDEYYRDVAVAAGMTDWWEPNCATNISREKQYHCNGVPGECCPQCDNYHSSTATCYTRTVQHGHVITTTSSNSYILENPTAIGCPALYSKIWNSSSADDHWCDGISLSCGDPSYYLTANQRFHLGLTGGPDVPVSIRDKFAWQWYRLMGMDESDKKKLEKKKKVRYTRYAPPTGDPCTVKYQFGPELVGVDLEEGSFPSVDIDFDTKEEDIIKILRKEHGVIRKMLVLDYQEGDLDFTINDKDLQDDSTLTGSVLMPDNRVITYDGSAPGASAFFYVEEGKLYTMDTHQYVRTTSMKDQIDMIERRIKLAHDTGRFCSGTTPVAVGQGAPGYWTAETPNPVQACCSGSGCCESGGNENLTCMDMTDLIIYVRSSIKDMRGRKWVTETKTF